MVRPIDININGQTTKVGTAPLQSEVSYSKCHILKVRRVTNQTTPQSLAVNATFLGVSAYFFRAKKNFLVFQRGLYQLLSRTITLFHEHNNKKAFEKILQIIRVVFLSGSVGFTLPPFMESIIKKNLHLLRTVLVCRFCKILELEVLT